MKEATTATWRLAASAAGVFVLALLFAFVAIVWLLLPRDASIKPVIVVPVIFGLIVALLVVMGAVVRRGLNGRWRT